ncbi:protein glutamine dumper 4 [Quercus suber]|uniref:Protein glutamine dumper 4 n=1 Tax=Quercus suber TaxID=58331 RepID=A0AAW0KXL1_QUESU|nr:protein GLUTAMINE DUMPER 4-like [Quercus suber]POF20274.1 protein glutamine dumper 4 [Quercus suber]
MRPASNSTTVNVDAGFRNFNSPIPYLFGGLALMLGLIAVALLILACSYGKTFSNSPSDAEEKQAKSTVNMKADSEPKVVVIMAGDDIPTYLAKPVSSTGHSEEV